MDERYPPAAETWGRKLERLNATSEGQHVAALFRQAYVIPQDRALLLAELVRWTMDEQPELDAVWVEEVTGLLARMECHDPERLHDRLAESWLEDASNLLEAGEMLLSNLADIVRVA